VAPRKKKATRKKKDEDADALYIPGRGQPKRRRKPPLPYNALFNKIPKQRPVAADKIDGLFSDRELRVIVKHNNLTEGDHSKIAKAKAVALFFNSGRTSASLDLPEMAAGDASVSKQAIRRCL